jgi:hypothetical protein
MERARAQPDRTLDRREQQGGAQVPDFYRESRRQTG